ncbi:MAG: Sec-independent protein translocase subunit TatA/TatB [Planctomycetota bacterium]|jgi:TatA/E family protein of Tat protein translocase
MPFNLSTGEILVLLLVAVVVFGGKLPDVARKVGRGLTQFRRGMAEEMRRIDDATRPSPPSSASPSSASPVDDPPPPSWRPPADGQECKGMEEE